MGSSVSISTDGSNERLVDKLIETGFIKVRPLFPSHYDDYKSTVYNKDQPWNVGNVYLSSPIVYARVLENLDLQRGMHFLNVGSGIGYFSTICGLLIGRKGVNHGIEVNENVAILARTMLEEFLRTSPQTGGWNFCQPEFVTGNCSDTAPAPKTYDRIYVGAASTNESVGHIFDMLKIGGICIVPIGDSLVKITRTGSAVETKILLTANFPNLINPVGPSCNVVQLPPIPKSLAFQALAQIPGVTLSNVEEWLQTAKLVLRGDPTYDDICQYIGNGQEHGFGIKVLKIIRIIRKNDHPLGQQDPTLQTKLRMLLWHGTQVHCIPSILKHGLQLPQSRGQMFGSGIYFADRASKSANYSAKRKMYPQVGEVGYMLLCEVLLGDIYNARKPRKADSKPPTIIAMRKGEVTKPCDSVKCTGEYVPDRRQQKIIDQNVVLPYGKTIRNKRFPLYTVKFNEFTVYSGERCKPNHLVEFQFTPTPEPYSRTCRIK